MKAELPPLHSPALWLSISISSSSNCFSLSLSISASFNHSQCMSVSFSLLLSTQHWHPSTHCFLLQCRVQNEITQGSAEQIACGIIFLFKPPHLTHTNACISTNMRTIVDYVLYVIPLTQNTVLTLKVRNWFS